MDRNAHAVPVADLLSHRHKVTHLHQGPTGRTDMLLHRDYHVRRRLQDGRLFSACQFFSSVWMYAAGKKAFHLLTSML